MGISLSSNPSDVVRDTRTKTALLLLRIPPHGLFCSLVSHPSAGVGYRRKKHVCWSCPPRPEFLQVLHCYPTQALVSHIKKDHISMYLTTIFKFILVFQWYPTQALGSGIGKNNRYLGIQTQGLSFCRCFIEIRPNRLGRVSEER